MKLQSLNNLSFQKLLVANCNLRNSRGLVPCSIYQLNSNEDSNYLVDIMCNDTNWTYPTYFEHFHKNMPSSYNEKFKIYAVENNSTKRCLALAQTSDENNNINLDYIVVNDKDRRPNRRRSSQEYIGETLLAYLAKLAQKTHKNAVFVPCVSVYATNFYKKCNFEVKKGSAIQKTNSDEAQELISQNEIHNYSKINLVG